MDATVLPRRPPDTTAYRGDENVSELGHDLHAEFPEDQIALTGLKLDNAHFRGLASQHHELTQQIFRIDSGLDAASDIRLETLKKQRLGLLDEIAAMIADRKAN
jgi:uncharacterized protein YdcH (DUF465 family)